MSGVPSSNRGGGTTPALTGICDLTLSGTQASFDTNTILGGNLPTTYKDLLVRVTGRSDTAATNTQLMIIFNNDAGAHYEWQYIAGFGATPSAQDNTTQNNAAVGFISAASDTAGHAGVCWFMVPDYTGTTFHKMASSVGTDNRTTSGPISGVFSALWNQTSAVTRITATPNAGSFVAGSRFTVYGVG